MSDNTIRVSAKKRLLWMAAGCAAFLLLFVVAIRITVGELFRGIAANKATGLSALGWDTNSMWASMGRSVDKAFVSGEPWISRSADLRTHSSQYERSVDTLHQIVSRHRGYFEDLRTETRSGYGRALAAVLAVPSEEFDATVAELRNIGRVESTSQAGEDSAVKVAAASRHLAAAQTNLSRLQKLQRERKGALADAVALEKDIAQADETVAQAERERDGLLSTVAQAHIQVTLLEDYRAPLQVSIAGAVLEVRNSIIEGIGAIFNTISFALSVLFSYGLPLLFWLAVLFFPSRSLYKWLRGRRSALPALSTTP
jgi:Domain of unknown function (DUF4349)